MVTVTREPATKPSLGTSSSPPRASSSARSTACLSSSRTRPRRPGFAPRLARSCSPGMCPGGRDRGREIEGRRRGHPRQDGYVRLRGGLVLVLVADRPHQESIRPERESGGSSAGTAAGVAANFGLVGIGEDTGGSIRVPAAYNNLFGLRVTTGLISRAGFSPLVHFQDTPAPVARTVSDLAATLDSIVGYDPKDPFTVTASAAHVSAATQKRSLLTSRSHSWRIGVLETGFGADDNPDAEPVTQGRFGRRSPGSANSACRRPASSRSPTSRDGSKVPPCT